MYVAPIPNVLMTLPRYWAPRFVIRCSQCGEIATRQGVYHVNNYIGPCCTVQWCPRTHQHTAGCYK